MSELKANGKTIPLLGEATLINTGSINDLIDTGCYWITSAVSDLPASSWCVAIVLHCQDSGFQILFTTSGEKMCVRYMGGGNNFSPWRILSIPAMVGGGRKKTLKYSSFCGCEVATC